MASAKFTLPTVAAPANSLRPRVSRSTRMPDQPQPASHLQPDPSPTMNTSHKEIPVRCSTACSSSASGSPERRARLTGLTASVGECDIDGIQFFSFGGQLALQLAGHLVQAGHDPHDVVEL